MLLIKFLNNLFKKGGFLLEDANGKEHIVGKPQSENPMKMKIHDKKLHYKLLLYPDLYFGEGYTDGKITFKNATVSDFLDLALQNIGREKTNTMSDFINTIRGSYRYLTNFNFIKKSKMNVAHHYDISDDLYFLFLDSLKQYSCAYFKNDNDSLEEAQKNKINHVIKKLNIKENSKVLDIGSGWGHLSIEIARQAKCQVIGVTLSENQYKYSNQKVKELNLGNQVQFKLMDYREIKEKYDRIISVGMFEHVGRKFYKTFFNKISKILKDDGIALLHTIGSVNSPRNPQPWITKYIFPGGYTPSLSEVAGPIEKSGLILSDIEVLRMHYAHTLSNWKYRFVKNKEKVLQIFDERFFRMFEFYLSSCEMAFKYGDQVVYQLQLTKRLNATPSTRDYIYS
tara:strand:+ start:886 stop:2076 length:1191 start_codon:yes stop_codon:yes gene_type:complete